LHVLETQLLANIGLQGGLLTAIFANSEKQPFGALRTRAMNNGLCMSTEISEVTRRAIIDFFTMSQTHWSGRLQDNEFLARLYDLHSLPSQDNRFKNAAGDIFQHRVRNSDWENDWVFYDSRFNLLYETDEVFLRFLRETVHPIVRPDPDEVRKLVDVYNRELAPDRWELVAVKEVSGKPIFAAQQVGRVAVFEEPTGWQKVDRQLQEVRLRLDTAATEEQYQAVGLLCREVLISVAQEVYDPTRHPSVDGVAPSDSDAKRMLEAVFESDLRGSESKEARSHARAAVNLSLALQHKRTADFRMAALCAEGTLSVVNMLAILAGRRGPSPR
jgi:hypothetical protein